MLATTINLFAAMATAMNTTSDGTMTLSHAFGAWERAGLTLIDAVTGDYVARLIAAEMKADDFDDSTDVFFSAEDLEHLHAFAKVLNDLSDMCAMTGEVFSSSLVHDSVLARVASDTTGTTYWDAYGYVGTTLREATAKMLVEARNAKGLPSLPSKWSAFEYVDWEKARSTWIMNYRSHYIDDPWPDSSFPNTRRAVITPASLIT